MTELKKWAAPKATPLLIVSLAMLLSSVLRVEASVIKGLRLGSSDEYVRLVLEFDQPLTPPPSYSINRNTLQVSLAGVINDLSAPQTDEYRADIASLDVSRASNATRIEVVFSFEPADVQTFSLTGPHRFIIDTYRPAFTSAARTPEKSTSAEISTSITEVSSTARDSVGSDNTTADDLNRNRFQQHLIAALIVVTTLIVILLVWLIWIGNDRKKPPAPSWAHLLPPIADRNIDTLDSVIRKHLKTMAMDDATGQETLCPSKK